MGTPSRREANAAALYALVDAAAGTVVDLVVSSRVLRHYDDVAPAEMPALFQTQKPETNDRGGGGQQGNLPPKRTQHFELWLYTSDAQAPTVVPAQQMNFMADAIEAAMAPSPITGVNNLGGLCAHAWIEGSVEYYENVTSDGKSIAVIPIAVLMP